MLISRIDSSGNCKVDTYLVLLSFLVLKILDNILRWKCSINTDVLLRSKAIEMKPEGVNVHYYYVCHIQYKHVTMIAEHYS